MVQPRGPLNTEFEFDPDSLSLLTVENTNDRGHRGILLIDDTHTLATLQGADAHPFLTLKVNFVGIPNWKSYVRLSFHIRVAKMWFGPFENIRYFESLHEAHVFLGKECVREVKVEEITQEAPIAEYCRTIGMRWRIENHLLYLLTISFDPTTLKKYGFNSETAEEYPELLRVNTLFEGSKLLTVRCLLMTDPDVLNHLEQFQTELRYNVPDYGAFYAGHPTQHFLKLGDYPTADLRPKVQVPGSLTLDDWSEYTTVYGFGCVYEHEVEERRRNMVMSEPFNLRVMAVPGPKDRYFIGFLEKPDDRNVRFNTGDRLTINFFPNLRLEEQNWPAVVIDTLPCTPQGDICISMCRPRDSKSGEYSSEDVNPMPYDIASSEAAFRLVSRHLSHAVHVDILTNTETFKRQIVGLNKLFKEESCRWWKEFLLGKTMNVLTHSNIYSKCPSGVLDLIPTEHFNTGQNRALEYVQALPNGVGIITGPAGTGKTQFILDILQPFLSNRNTNHPQVLVCTPNNAAADDLARRLHSQSQDNGETKNAVIIRMHSVSTEKEVLDAAAVSTFVPDSTTCDIPVHHVEETTDMPLLNITSMIYHAFNEPYKRTHGVKDKRYILHRMSLATWMMRVAGLLAADDPMADIKRHGRFRYLYDQQRANVSLDKDEQKSFGIARQALRKRTLELAHVVITTASNAGDHSLYSTFKPALIVVDEASRLLEADSWNLLGNYNKTPLIMIGDENQLRPVVASTSENNGFLYSMQVSLFHRLKLLGHPSVLLNVQYRMLDVIGNMVSDLFYARKLTNGSGTDLASRPVSQAILRYVQGRWKIGSPMVGLDVKGHREKDSTKSSVNFVNVSVVMNLALDMIGKEIVAPAQLVILTFYRAQYKIYRQALRNLSLAQPRMADIQVKTVDIMQGGQGTVIIMDLVVCNRVGFLQSMNRLNVSCSRAMDGLFVVGDLTGIMNERPNHRRHLGNVITYISKLRARVKMVDTEQNKYVPTSLSHGDLEDRWSENDEELVSIHRALS